jgi:hypothetical protein
LQTEQANVPQEGPISTKRRLLGVLLGGLAGGSQYGNRQPGAAREVGSEATDAYLHGPYERAMAAHDKRLGELGQQEQIEEKRNVFGMGQQRETEEQAYRTSQLGLEGQRVGFEKTRAEAEEARARAEEARAEREIPGKIPTKEQAETDFLLGNLPVGVSPDAFLSRAKLLQRATARPEASGTNSLIWLNTGGGVPTPMVWNNKLGRMVPARDVPPGAQPIAEARTDEANVMQRMNSARSEVEKFFSESYADPLHLTDEEKQKVGAIYGKYNLQADAQGNVAPIAQQQAVTPGQGQGGPPQAAGPQITQFARNAQGQRVGWNGQQWIPVDAQGNPVK